MTTASLTFAAMEAPILEDSMEMASPYQGNVDDFDIDLDVMEDHVSNADEDLMVADATPEPSHIPVYIEDDARDADMIDDVADAQQGSTDATTVAYGVDEAYEAEMLEDEYDEDIDAPFPESTQNFTSHDRETDTQGVTHEVEWTNDAVPEEDHEETDRQLHSEPDAVNDNNLAQPLMGAVETDVSDSQYLRENRGDAPNTIEHGNEQQDDYYEGGVEVDKQQIAALEEHSNVSQSAKQHEYDEVQPQFDTQKDDNAGTTGAEPYQKSANDEHSVDEVQLPLVRVLYQENEISLFPPQEGDSSETFFLENEDLAYEGFDKLLEACRQVLGDHVGEHEILVVDVNFLNIQLREDSIHLPHISLHQIINIYLHLCHNDNIDEPGALYLTLSTKPSLLAEVSELLAAANEGKGLSQIQDWDNWDEVSPDPVQPDLDRRESVISSTEAPGEPERDEHRYEDHVLDTSNEASAARRASTDEAAGLAAGHHDSENSEEVQDEGISLTVYLHRNEDPGHIELNAEEYEELDNAHEEVVGEDYESELRKSESTTTLTSVVAPSSEKTHNSDEVADNNSRTLDQQTADDITENEDQLDTLPPGTNPNVSTDNVNNASPEESAEGCELTESSSFLELYPVGDSVKEEPEEGEISPSATEEQAPESHQEDDGTAGYETEDYSESDSSFLRQTDTVNESLADEKSVKQPLEDTPAANARQDNDLETFTVPVNSDAIGHVSPFGAFDHDTEDSVLDVETEHIDFAYGDGLDVKNELAVAAEIQSPSSAAAKRSREDGGPDYDESSSLEVKRSRSS